VGWKDKKSSVKTDMSVSTIRQTGKLPGQHWVIFLANGTINISMLSNHGRKTGRDSPSFLISLQRSEKSFTQPT